MADLEELLGQIHTALAKEFLKRIKSGDAAPADLAAAIRFLKDNGVSSTRTPTNPLGQLADLVPFPQEDDREV